MAKRWSLHALCVPPLATEPSRRLLHLFGTVCRSQYGHRRHCKFFAADWRPSFLPGRTAALTKSVSLHWLPRDFTAIITCYVSLQSQDLCHVKVHSFIIIMIIIIKHLRLLCGKRGAACRRYFGDSVDITDVFHDSENLMEFLISSGHLPPPLI